MADNVYDAIVVGGGAAGMFAAAFCATNGLNVLLLERNKSLGRKLLLTGGGRCNITNRFIDKKDFNSSQLNKAFNIIKSFDNKAVCRYFERAGTKFVFEKDGCAFPESQEAMSVLLVLSKALASGGVNLRTQEKVLDIKKKGDLFYVSTNRCVERGRCVLISTGGSSYPHTGSDGNGLIFARRMGHKIIPSFAALSPLCIKDKMIRNLTGISVPCKLALFAGKKRVREYTDSLLFTHFGISGIGVLNISRHWHYARNLFQDVRLEGNFFTHIRQDEWEKEFTLIAKRSPHLSLRKYLAGFFAARFADFILSKAGICLTEKMTLTREKRHRLVECLYHFKFCVQKAYGLKKAEATAGGVDLAGLDKTLQSLKVPGLFFAGEICDVDGQVGGYNLQWAWSSAYASACGINKFKLGESA